MSLAPKYDPFDLLAITDEFCWLPDENPIGEACSAFDPSHPEPLIELLRSEDPGVVQAGLSVFGWLYDKGLIVVDVALESVGHPSKMARSALMDGLLCYSRRLTPRQISHVLPLAEDSEDLVRDKMVSLLGSIRTKILEAAIDLVEDDTDRARHAEAFNKASAPMTSSQAAFDAGVKAEPLISTYMLASILRAARQDEHLQVPDYSGTDYVGEGTILQTKRLVAGTRRRRAKPISLE